MYLINFIVRWERHIQSADIVSHCIHLLLQGQAWFWLQMGVVVIGAAWCITLISIICFGGWYAHTHPKTGNDRVIQQLVRLLWLLTFGLTDSSLPDLESEDTGREVEREQGMFAEPRRSFRRKA